MWRPQVSRVSANLADNPNLWLQKANISTGVTLKLKFRNMEAKNKCIKDDSTFNTLVHFCLIFRLRVLGLKEEFGEFWVSLALWGYIRLLQGSFNLKPILFCFSYNLQVIPKCIMKADVWAWCIALTERSCCVTMLKFTQMKHVRYVWQQHTNPTLNSSQEDGTEQKTEPEFLLSITRGETNRRRSHSVVGSAKTHQVCRKAIKSGWSWRLPTPNSDKTNLMTEWPKNVSRSLWGFLGTLWAMRL